MESLPVCNFLPLPLLGSFCVLSLGLGGVGPQCQHLLHHAPLSSVLHTLLCCFIFTLVTVGFFPWRSCRRVLFSECSEIFLWSLLLISGVSSRIRNMVSKHMAVFTFQHVLKHEVAGSWSVLMAVP